jgi:hypothetical protein
MYEEVTAGEREVCNEELHSFYSSPYSVIIRMIKPRGVKWMGYVA